MKKIFRVLLTVVLAAVMVFALTACKSDCEKGNHTLTDVAAVNATCTTEGNVAYKHCDVCGKNFAADGTELANVVTSATGHTLTNVAAVAATCTTEGVIAHKHCSVCEKNFALDGTTELPNVVAPIVAHVLNDVAAVGATCTSTGNVAYKHCSVCEQNFDADGNVISVVVIDKVAHALADVPAVAATCTSAGNIAHKKCSECQGLFNADGDALTAEDVVVAINADAHAFGTLNAAVPATCTAEGTVAYKTCSLCEKKFSEAGVELDSIVAPIVADAHVWGEWAADSNGTSHTKVCTLTATHTETKNCDLATIYGSNDTQHWFTCEVCSNKTTAVDHEYVGHICVCGAIEPGYARQLVKVTAPVADVAYKFVIDQKGLEKTLFMTGEMSGFYGATSEDISESADIYAELTTDGFYLYVLNADNSKGYISLVVSGTYINIKFLAEPTTVLTWNDELSCVQATAGDTTYYLGTYRTFETFSWSKTSYLPGTTNYPAFLAQDVIVCTHSNIAPVAEIAATCTTAGNIGYFKCGTCGATFSDVEGTTPIALADTVVAATGHDWNNWVAIEGSNEHSRICKKDASHVETAACVVDEWTTTDATNHYQICEVCSAQRNVAPHDFGAGVDCACGRPYICTHATFEWKHDEVNGEHYQICKLCGDESTITNRGECVLVYAQIAETTTHKGVCETCARESAVANCDGEWVTDETNHSKKCDVCDGTIVAEAGHTLEDVITATTHGKACSVCTYATTPVEHVYVGHVCSCGTVEAGYAKEQVQVTNPVADVAYRVLFVKASDSLTYYMTGAMSGYYGATSNDIADAAVIYAEVADGGFYLYILNADSTKSYISLQQSGSYNNFKFLAEPTTVLTLNDNGGIQAVISGTTFILGTSGTYKTFSWNTSNSDLAIITAEEYVCQHEGATLTEAKAVTCEADGNVAYYTCPTCGRHFEEATCENEIENVVLVKLGHNWGEWVADDGANTHSRVCANDNGHIETENCVLAYEKDPTQHWQVCATCARETTKVAHEHIDDADCVCGKPATCAHETLAWAYDEATNEHYQICADCSDETSITNRGECVLVYTRVADTLTHEGVCETCARKVTIDCDGEWTTAADKHSKNCTLCGEVIVAETDHTAVWGEITLTTHSFTCSDCGYASGVVEHNDNDDAKAICDVCGKFLTNLDVTLTSFADATAAAPTTNNVLTDEWYYVIGKISAISNSTYGNLTIVNEAGETFTVYGSFNFDGSVAFGSMETVPAVGDVVVFYSRLSYYNAPQLKNARVVEIKGVEQKASAAYVLSKLSAIASPAQADFDLPTVDGYTISWSVPQGTTALSIADGRATVVRGDEDVTVVITASVEVDGITATRDFTVVVPGENTATPVSVGTISFATADQRVSQTGDKQVWSNAGITFTNNQGSSTSAVVDAVNPVKVYSKSNVIIEYGLAIHKIVIVCDSASYATVVVNSITTGATAVADGATVTITLETPATSFTFTASGQTRWDSIEVFALPCDHADAILPVDGTPATCTELATVDHFACSLCGKTFSDAAGETPLEVITTGELAAHTYTTKYEKDSVGHALVCDVCGAAGTKVDHDFTSGNCVCGQEKPAEGAATETYDFTAQGYTTTTTITDFAMGQVSVAVGQKTTSSQSNPPKYYTSGTAVRMYSDNSFTFTAAEGYVITSIKILSAGYSSSVAWYIDGTQVSDGKTDYTWTGSSNSVVFAANPGSSSGQTRITGFVVTYEPVA